MTQAASDSTRPATGIEYDLPCPKCEYNLRGLPTTRCPECGYTLSQSELTASEIPWTRRRARGRVRAYCQTVWMLTFRSRRFRMETDRHVQYDDGQRLRWVTVMLVYLPWLLGTCVLVALGKGDALDVLYFGDARKVAAIQVVPHGCLLLFLAAATGLPSYFFHSRHLPVEMQNRGITLSYYTCGVLAWLLPAYLFLVAAVLYARRFNSEAAMVVGVVVLCGTVLLVMLHWAVLVRKLANQILGPGRAWTTTWLLIPLWILLAFGTLIVLPGMIFWIMLMVSSIL